VNTAINIFITAGAAGGVIFLIVTIRDIIMERIWARRWSKEYKSNIEYWDSLWDRIDAADDWK
jgi:hypothetical protein